MKKLKEKFRPWWLIVLGWIMFIIGSCMPPVKWWEHYPKNAGELMSYNIRLFATLVVMISMLILVAHRVEKYFRKAK